MRKSLLPILFSVQLVFFLLPLQSDAASRERVPAVSLTGDGDDYYYREALQSLERTVPLTYNSAVRNYIKYFSRQKNRFGRMVGLSQYYFPIYEKVFKERNVPDEIKYLSVVESSLNPNAVSGYGATGPWQFLYEYGKIYGLTITDSLDERRDPYLASNAAASYLLDSYNMYGDWLLAIASYNCGRNNIKWAMEKAGGKVDYWTLRPYLPVETQNYVPAYIATVYLMNNYRKHGIKPIPPSLSLHNDVFIIRKSVSLQDVANVSRVSLEELCALNPSYTKLFVSVDGKKPKNLIVPYLPDITYNAVCNLLGVKSARPVEPVPAPVVRRVQYYITYRAQPGDNVDIIAGKFKGVSADEIKYANHLDSGSVAPGTLLKIVQYR